VICPNTGNECEALEFVSQASRMYRTAASATVAIRSCASELDAAPMSDLPKINCGYMGALVAKDVLENQVTN
jgi:hypothetical protein